MRLKENNLEGRATRDKVTVVGLGEERHGSLVVRKSWTKGPSGPCRVMVCPWVPTSAKK